MMIKKILVVDCGSRKVPDIVSMLSGLSVKTETIKLEQLPGENTFDYSGVVISGAPILLTGTNYTDYLIYSTPIKNTDVPVLGICFGHQLIGLHYGANISLCDEDRSENKIYKKAPGKLLNTFGDTFMMREDHTEEISLPPGFRLIASSENCLNEAMEHENKSIYGVQFHPESSGENGKILFRNFLEIC